jgi:lysophospholipase L1-like esterase
LSRSRSLVPNLLLLAASCAVALLVVEVALRLTTSSVPAAPPEQGRGKASRFDPLLGWANKEGARTRLETPEFSAEVTINSKGLRGREVPYERTPGRPRIALLGDSFAWGFGVSDDEVIAVRLEEALGGAVEALNMGTIGFGTDQELLFYRQEGRRYAPDVVLLVFCSNDVTNNVSDRDRWYGKPRFVIEGDSLRLTNVPISSETSWDAWLTEYRPDQPGAPAQAGGAAPGGGVARGKFVLRRTFRSYGFLLERWQSLRQRLEMTRPGLFADGFSPWLDDSWRITFRLIEELRDEVEAGGARFVVLNVPRLEQMWYDSWVRPNVTLAAFCEGAHIAYYDFTPAFRRAPNAERMFFRRDGHWNADGHRFAAERLAEFLKAEGLVPGGAR